MTRLLDTYPMNAVCASCGDTFGSHSGLICPGNKTQFALLVEPEKQTQGVEDHPLYPIFMAAIEQAMFGKGERHGGARTPFLEQPWVHYLKMHGRGFATGQAAKKLEEAASTREGAGFETEVFGAIVYAGMAILKERGEV